MLLEETVRVALFVGAISLVFLAAVREAIEMAAERLGFRPVLDSPVALLTRPLVSGHLRRRVRRIVFALAATGLSCIGYGALVEPWWLEVTHVRAPSRHWTATRPLRIVHISDLHCEARPRLEDRLPEVIAAQAPDLIAFTGDAINEPAGLPVFRRLLARLARIAPTFAVRGNWDVWFHQDLDLFAGTGVRALDADAVRLDVAGTSLWIAGLAFGADDRLEDVLGRIAPGATTLLLHHTPDLIERVAVRGVDLYLAGHTHGGQVALPFYGALITYSRYGKRFESGMARVGETSIYVNRGIGLEGLGAPPVRFLARPEVTVIELLPAKDPRP